jgi:hypothetical protein
MLRCSQSLMTRTSFQPSTILCCALNHNTNGQPLCPPQFRVPRRSLPALLREFLCAITSLFSGFPDRNRGKIVEEVVVLKKGNGDPDTLSGRLGLFEGAVRTLQGAADKIPQGKIQKINSSRIKPNQYRATGPEKNTGTK